MAGLGVVVADSLGWEPDGWSVQVAAITAALLAAGVLVWTERRLPRVQEAVIGVVFVVAASAEVILFSFNPHGAEHLKDLLVGQIIWVSPPQLAGAAVVAVVFHAIAARGNLGRNRPLFYGLFALAITASVQLVDVFLVFTSLIVPALGARGHRRPLLAGYGVGLAGHALGLLGSVALDLPTGATIVCALAAVGGTVGLVRRMSLPQ